MNSLPVQEGKTVKTRLCFLLLALLSVISYCNGDASMFRYPYPRSINLKLMPEPLTKPGITLLTGIVESRLGNLRDIRIYFESSKDFAVVPDNFSIDQLGHGVKRRMRIAVKEASGKPNASGSWVRMRVKYLPDYDSMLSSVEKSQYLTDENERNRLIDTIRNNSGKQAFQTDAVRFDINPEKIQRR